MNGAATNADKRTAVGGARQPDNRIETDEQAECACLPEPTTAISPSSLVKKREFVKKRDVMLDPNIDVESCLFAVPLPEVLTDAKHGDHTHFELITTTVTLASGAEGTGYTYTGGKGGHAIYAVLEHDIKPSLLGRNGRDIAGIAEWLEWHTHYVGRGGIAGFANSAVDIALWDCHGKETSTPLWKMAGGAAKECKAYRGGIDLKTRSL